jgi:undecaprenyl-diphosphatase
VDALQAIVLGIVQGLTEYLPISSTAHLRIVPAFMGWEDPGAAFTAVTQLGTMAAVLLYFRADLWRIARTWTASLRRPELRSELDARMGWYIVLGTIPIGIFGLVFADQIESGARDLYLIGTTLIVLGLVLLLAERVAARDRSIEDITRRDGILIGFAQALALVPGVSRSGATITAGLFLGFDRASAARYSFLLSVPAVVVSGLFELRKIGEDEGTGVGPTILATIAAFIVGYASIAFLLRWLARHSTAVFVAYRVALGVLVLALAGAGVIA